MPVIRKKLAPSDVYPEDIRYNPDTDEVQRLINGEWVDAPESDPRTQTTFPPRITADTPCDAVQSLVDQLKNTIDQTIAAIEAAATVFAIAGLILGLFTFGVFDIFISLALTLGGAMVDAGSGSLTTALTPEVYEQLKCILRCYMTEDGRVKPGSLPAIQGRVNSEIGGLAATVINSMLALAGEGGLNNLAATGTSTGDCSECDPCVTCVDKWTVQFGELVGVTDDGYLRVNGDTSSGQTTITLITDDPSECCTLLDVRIIAPLDVTPSGIMSNGVHINCGTPVTFENLISGLSLGGCYDYLGVRLAPTDDRAMTADFLFDICP